MSRVLLTILAFESVFFSFGLGFGVHEWRSSFRLEKSVVESNKLVIQADSPFKVALFADLHFGEDAWTDWGPRQDRNSINLMSFLLDTETPVYLGDVITANNIAIKNASLYWEQALSPTRDRGIPWATVFGNHDDAPFVWPLDWFSSSGVPKLYCPDATDFMKNVVGEEECSFRGTTRVELMSKEVESNLLSYSSSGPKDLWPSVSNYVLNVSSCYDSAEPLLYLYFLDSGGGSYPEVISSAQTEWFRKKSKEVNPHLRVPEIIFWHIPSRAFRNVAPEFSVHSPCVGSINKEEVASQEAEMGIMHLLLHRSSVKAVFVGHNHGLDWCCPYEKLWLCFARHTGYGGYGNWSKGARILEITQRPFTLKTWIRMEDNSVHSEVVLA